MSPDTLVCANCGAADISMTGSHGWVQCNECAYEGQAVAFEDFEPSETMQGLIPIPEGYSEP